MKLRLSSKEQEELVLKNQRLVHYLVRKLGVAPSDYEDMIQVGTIGLIKAAATFGKSGKTKFSTYAGICINNELFMHFRKVKRYNKEIFFDDVLHVDKEGNELTLEDLIPDPESDFIEEIIEIDDYTRIISIILNTLTTRETLILLYRIAGADQDFVSQTLNISRSYVSRLERKLRRKVKLYFNENKQFEEVYKMRTVGNSYKISFATKDIKQFNNIFARILLNLKSVDELPPFRVNSNKERIIIQVPAELESFSFIAKIIQEIDNFEMALISNRNTFSIESNVEQQEVLEEAEETTELEKTVQEAEEASEEENEEDEGENVETCENVEEETVIEALNSTLSEVETSITPDVEVKTRKGFQSKSKIVRDYFLTLDIFTISELKEHFPSMASTTINNAIQTAKDKGLLTYVGRAKYKVNKT